MKHFLNNQLLKKTALAAIAFIISLNSAFTQHIIKGKVQDEKGIPIPGATVAEKGTMNGTVTDVDGNYSIQVTSYDKVLSIRSQGFKTQEISKLSDFSGVITLREETRQLENVLITATRTDRDLENIPQKLIVTNREVIEKTIANDITDLLKKTSGVDVIQYPGLLAGIGMRGFRPQFSGINQRTLTLIDGRPTGATNLATIDLNNVERIEVLKGPASALYGAQAMAGVVNIITKKSKGDIHGRVTGGIGSFGMNEGTFSVGGSITSKLSFDLSYRSFNQREDFRLGKDNLFRNALGWDNANRILWEETRQEISIPDDRGDGIRRSNTSFTSQSGSFRLGYEINDTWRAEVNAEGFVADRVNTPGDIEDGDTSPGLKDIYRYSGDVSLHGQLTSGLNVMVRGFTATEKALNYNLNVNDTTTIRTQWPSRSNNLDWTGAQLMGRQQIGMHFVTAGIDFTRIEQNNVSFRNTGEINNVSVRSPNFTQDQTGIYVQGELNFLDGRIQSTIGLRNEIIGYNITGTDLFDARSESSSILAPSLGINYNFHKNLYLHASYGEAFTTLNVFQMAGYDERAVRPDTADLWRGNPDLRMPTSQNIDLGIRYVDDVTGLSIDATFFNTRLSHNVVARVENFPGQRTESGAVIRNLNTFQNAESTRLSGIELDLHYRFKNAGIDVSAGLVQIVKAEELREIFNQPDPLILPMHNVANTNVNLAIEYNKIPWLQTRLSGRYVGRRFDTDWSFYLGSENVSGVYADVEYPPFIVLDWSTFFNIKKHTVGVMVNNLTDENYYEKRGFNLMGRNVMLRYAINL